MGGWGLGGASGAYDAFTSTSTFLTNTVSNSLVDDAVFEHAQAQRQEKSYVSITFLIKV